MSAWLHLRVYRKPIQASEAALRQLRDNLTEAAARQQKLAAKSPYVLRLAGPLQEREDAWVVAHEPAEPLLPRGIFDPDQPPVCIAELIELAYCASAALAAAHQFSGGRVMHGAVCPAVLLATPDGRICVADFGVGPAYCRELGDEYYRRLAIGTVDSNKAEAGGTAVWECLDDTVEDCEHRLMPFIPLEEYQQGQFSRFEPAGDMYSLGVVAYAAAEQRHPYVDAPGAHRDPHLHTYILLGLMDRLRRADLVSSKDPACAAWCDAVQRAISAIVSKRPAAAEMAARLAEYRRQPESYREALIDALKLLMRNTRRTVKDTLPADAVALELGALRWKAGALCRTIAAPVRWQVSLREEGAPPAKAAAIVTENEAELAWSIEPGEFADSSALESAITAALAEGIAELRRREREREQRERELQQRRAEEERQRKLEEERQRKLAEEQRRKLEQQQRELERQQRKAEDERQRKLEEERQRKLDEERQRKLAEERQRTAEDERQRRLEEERQRKLEEEQQRKLAEEQRRKREFEEQQRRAEEDRKRKAEEEQQRKLEEERQRRLEEERQRKLAEEERHQREQQERERQRQQRELERQQRELARRRKAEEEQQRKLERQRLKLAELQRRRLGELLRSVARRFPHLALTPVAELPAEKCTATVSGEEDLEAVQARFSWDQKGGNWAFVDDTLARALSGLAVQRAEQAARQMIASLAPKDAPDTELQLTLTRQPYGLAELARDIVVPGRLEVRLRIDQVRTAHIDVIVTDKPGKAISLSPGLKALSAAVEQAVQQLRPPPPPPKPKAEPPPKAKTAPAPPRREPETAAPRSAQPAGAPKAAPPAPASRAAPPPTLQPQDVSGEKPVPLGPNALKKSAGTPGPTSPVAPRRVPKRPRGRRAVTVLGTLVVFGVAAILVYYVWPEAYDGNRSTPARAIPSTEPQTHGEGHDNNNGEPPQRTQSVQPAEATDQPPPPPPPPPPPWGSPVNWTEFRDRLPSEDCNAISTEKWRRAFLLAKLLAKDHGEVPQDVELAGRQYRLIVSGAPQQVYYVQCTSERASWRDVEPRLKSARDALPLSGLSGEDRSALQALLAVPTWDEWQAIATQLHADYLRQPDSEAKNASPLTEMYTNVLWGDKEWCWYNGVPVPVGGKTVFLAGKAWQMPPLSAETGTAGQTGVDPDNVAGQDLNQQAISGWLKKPLVSPPDPDKFDRAKDPVEVGLRLILHVADFTESDAAASPAPEE